MYKQVNIVEDVIEQAADIVTKQDRSKYDVFIAAAEKYCILNKGIIGGIVGVEMVSDACTGVSSKTHNSYQLDIYIDDTLRHAKGLADYLYTSSLKTDIDGSTIAMTTKLKYKYFTIWINTRASFNVINIDRYRNVKLIDLIIPVLAPCRFNPGEFVYCMNVELALLYIYQKLYQPYSSSRGYVSYSQLLKYEQVLIESIGKLKVGGRSKKSFNKYMDASDIIDEFLVGDDQSNIVIGDYADETISGGVKRRRDTQHKRLQMISSEDPKAINGRLSRLVKRSMGNRYSSIVIEYDLKIPSDQQLRKYTFYVTDNNSQRPILDVFNSTTYETVPYHRRDNMNIAGYFVVLRFRFIDMYASKLIAALKRVEDTRYEGSIDNIMKLRDHISNKINDSPLEVFQTDNYKGIFVEENIVMKKLSAKYQYMFSPYYPIKK